MPIYEAIVERWQREKQERIEKNRIFDVEEKSGDIILLKRKRPVLKRATAISLFAGFWLFVNWMVFKSPVNQDVWIGWVILWGLIAPVMAMPFIYSGWLAFKGDVWIVDSIHCYLIHNGKDICPFHEMECVRVREYYGGPGAGIKYFYFAIVRKQGKQIILANYGYGIENQKELIDVAHLVAERIGVPTRIELLSF